jgi:hypothetical protein
VSVKCSDSQATLTGGRKTRIELLVPAGSNIPTQQWQHYRELANNVISVACGTPGTTLVIRPITSNSLAQPEVFEGSIPLEDKLHEINVSHNPVLKSVQSDFRKRAFSAVERLRSYPPIRHTDIIGALNVASASLATSDNTKRIIVAIGGASLPTGFEFGSKPSRELEFRKMISKLRSSAELPDLSGDAVYLVGVSSGPNDLHQAVSETLQQTCEFWTALFKSAGGNPNSCGPTIPDNLTH